MCGSDNKMEVALLCQKEGPGFQVAFALVSMM